MSSYETLQIESAMWQERGDILYDENVRLFKEYNEIADRLRERDKDNERLCKILIGNRLGHLTEIN